MAPGLRFKKLNPPFDLQLIVDKVACAAKSVGVEWHGEVDGAFPLSRACRWPPQAEGKLERVVDIAGAVARRRIVNKPLLTKCSSLEYALGIGGLGHLIGTCCVCYIPFTRQPTIDDAPRCWWCRHDGFASAASSFASRRRFGGKRGSAPPDVGRAFFGFPSHGRGLSLFVMTRLRP